MNGTDSAKIKFNNEEVGSLSVFSNRYDSRLEDFKSFNSFNEYFRITEIQIHNDVQQRERKEGIEGVYDRLLPEIRRLIGY